jgi:hypothetical protein
MVQCYTNPDALFYIGTVKLKIEKLALIVDTIFAGLRKMSVPRAAGQPHIKIVS